MMGSINDKRLKGAFWVWASDSSEWPWPRPWPWPSEWPWPWPMTKRMTKCLPAECMGGTGLEFESRKIKYRTQNASQQHFYCFLKEIWTIKSSSSLKCPPHISCWESAIHEHGTCFEYKVRHQLKYSETMTNPMSDHPSLKDSPPPPPQNLSFHISM